MTPNYLLLDHDAAYLMMPVTMPMPGHCRLRHRNGHRCCQYRRTCQRKEEFLHQNRAPLTPSPFLMPLAQQLPARAGTVFNAENAIRSRSPALITSLTPVKSPFNHRANTGPQCPVVFFVCARPRDTCLYFPVLFELTCPVGFPPRCVGKPCQASKTEARGGRVSFTRTMRFRVCLF